MSTTPKVLQELADACGGEIKDIMILPDGTGGATMSMPLPKDHWLTAAHPNVPPMRLRMPPGEERERWSGVIREAGKYALRCSTLDGEDDDIDPDALLQNLCVAFLGYWTDDGTSHLCGDPYDNPDPIPPIYEGKAP